MARAPEATIAQACWRFVSWGSTNDDVLSKGFDDNDNVEVVKTSHLNGLETLVSRVERCLYPIQRVEWCSALSSPPRPSKYPPPSAIDAVNKTMAEHLARVAARLGGEDDDGGDDSWIFREQDGGARVHLVGNSYAKYTSSPVVAWKDWGRVSAALEKNPTVIVGRCAHCKFHTLVDATTPSDACPICRAIGMKWTQVKLSSAEIWLPARMSRVYAIENMRISCWNIELIRNNLLMMSPTLRQARDLEGVHFADYCVGFRSPIDTAILQACVLKGSVDPQDLNMPNLLAMATIALPPATPDPASLLKDHQRRILNFFAKNKGDKDGKKAAIMCVGTGLGKTMMSIALARQMVVDEKQEPKQEALLVVVGAPILLENFNKGIENLHATGQDGPPSLVALDQVGADPSAFGPERAGVFVKTPLREIAVSQLKGVVAKQSRPIVLIVDEAHNFRNQGEGFEFVKGVSRACGDDSYRIAMTGTPVFSVRKLGDKSNLSSIVQIVTARSNGRVIEDYRDLRQFTLSPSSPYVPIAWSMTKTDAFPQQVYRSHTTIVDPAVYRDYVQRSVDWHEELKRFKIISNPRQRRDVLACVMRSLEDHQREGCKDLIEQITNQEEDSSAEKGISALVSKFDPSISDPRKYFTPSGLVRIKSCVMEAILGMDYLGGGGAGAAEFENIPFYHTNFRMQFKAPPFVRRSMGDRGTAVELNFNEWKYVIERDGTRETVGVGNAGLEPDEQQMRALRASDLYDPGAVEDIEMRVLLCAVSPPVRTSLLLLWRALTTRTLPIVFHGEYLNECIVTFYEAALKLVRLKSKIDNDSVDRTGACALVTGTSVSIGGEPLSGSDTTKMRSNALKRFKHGLVDVLCFSGVFAEGVNIVSNARLISTLNTFEASNLVLDLELVLNLDEKDALVYAFEWKDTVKRSTAFKPLRTIEAVKGETSGPGEFELASGAVKSPWNCFVRLELGGALKAANEDDAGKVKEALAACYVQNFVAPVRQFCHLHAMWNTTRAEQAEGRVVRTDSHPRMYHRGKIKKTRVYSPMPPYAHGQVEIHQVLCVRPTRGEVATGDEMRRRISARHADDTIVLQEELATNRRADLEKSCVRASAKHAEGGMPK